MILVNKWPRWMRESVMKQKCKAWNCADKRKWREQMLFLCMVTLFFSDIWLRLLGSFYNHGPILRSLLSHFCLFYLVFLLSLPPTWSRDYTEVGKGKKHGKHTNKEHLVLIWCRAFYRTAFYRMVFLFFCPHSVYLCVCVTVALWHQSAGGGLLDLFA